MENISRSQSSWLWTVVIGLVFVGVGAGLGAVTLRTLWRAGQMREWDEIPARVEACELEKHRGSKGDATYSVSATYRYTVDGREHTGQRVGLHTASDNFGSFQKQAYAMLEAARTSGGTVPCRVNPANPDEAILFWRPRVELLLFQQMLALVFGGIGMLLLSWLLFAGRGNILENGRVRMEGSNTHKMLTATVAVFILYLSALVGLARPVVGLAEIPWWGCLPFVATVLLSALAVYYWVRFKKFGVSVLELSPCPAIAGRTLRVTAHIPCHLEAEVLATLRHVHQYTSGSGKRSHTHYDEVWKETKSASVYMAGEDMSVARMEWEIDPGLVSTARRGGDGRWWELTLKAKTRGVDYKAVFALEVVQNEENIKP